VIGGIRHALSLLGKHKILKINNMSQHSIPLQIRLRDIDINHHVNNAVYFTYMEHARSEILYDEMVKYHKEGFQFVVAEANCKYIRPIKLGDKINCVLEFVPIRLTSCDIIYHFKNEKTGVLHAEGTTKMVLFNDNTGRPMAIPEWFTKKYLAPRSDYQEELKGQTGLG
jgi:acyl-CoA thioester hydrolase